MPSAGAADDGPDPHLPPLTARLRARRRASDRDRRGGEDAGQGGAKQPEVGEHERQQGTHAHHGAAHRGGEAAVAADGNPASRETASLRAAVS